jgi:hypothetical protein
MLLEWRAIGHVWVFESALVVSSKISERELRDARDGLSAALRRAGTLMLTDVIDIVALAIPSLRVGEIDSIARCIVDMDGHEVLPGLYSPSKWHREDFAAFVLEHEGKPLHFSEIALRMESMNGMVVNPVGLNSMLNASAKFVRVGAGDFALSQWGVRRYNRFDEVIERYLASGRVAEHESRIRDDLLDEYTVAPTTVAAMLIMNRQTFMHYGGGFWGLAGYEPVIEPVLEKKLVDLLRIAQRPLSAIDIIGEIRREQSFDRISESEVLRILFCSSVIRKAGNPKARMFQA